MSAKLGAAQYYLGNDKLMSKMGITIENIKKQVQVLEEQGKTVMLLAEKKKVSEQADASVIRAEMLLEDAKRKQEDGVAPLPGERTGNADGTSRLNETYQARQKLLAKGVANAEANFKKAQADQAALR